MVLALLGFLGGVVLGVLAASLYWLTHNPPLDQDAAPRIPRTNTALSGERCAECGHPVPWGTVKFHTGHYLHQECKAAYQGKG